MSFFTHGGHVGFAPDSSQPADVTIWTESFGGRDIPIIHYSPGAMTCVEDVPCAGKSAMDSQAPSAAPTSWAAMKPATSPRAIPAKVWVKPLASVTAGLANDVDAVNQ